uniref:Uncharacterized protein n=1 Tax=Oryza sativa subsp. japonica TaxID=39947 RepID=Q6YWL2_ORYSJ|nr:hypothetical protein [Oryza sativa Japonica Group]BAD10619.1 hypothetical protein [Oryza sativa Japonica Group]
MVEQSLNHRIVFFHVKKKDTKPQNGEAVHTPDPRSARTAEAKARCFRGPHAAAAAAAIAVSSDHHHKKRATHAAARCPFHDPKKKEANANPRIPSPPLPPPTSPRPIRQSRYPSVDLSSYLFFFFPSKIGSRLAPIRAV